jgi:hypothetical protein
MFELFSKFIIYCRERYSNDLIHLVVIVRHTNGMGCVSECHIRVETIQQHLYLFLPTGWGRLE